jgi:hypothetical protein
MRPTIVTRGILALGLAAAFLAATASTASATRTISPATVDYGNRQVGTTSPAQAFTLRVRCTLLVFPTTRCVQDTFSRSISITVGQFGVPSNQFTQTNNCPATMTGFATKPGVDPNQGSQTCTINVSFTPTGTGPRGATLRTGSGGPTAELSGNGVTTPTPPTPPTPGPAPPTLTLDLDAKKQELKKKLKFFATTNVDSTLEAGGSVKNTTKQLAAGEKTTIKAKLKKSKRQKLENKLATSGKAKAKVETVATDEFDNQAVEEIKVKLKG